MNVFWNENVGSILKARLRNRKKERDGHCADALELGLCMVDEIERERYGKKNDEETTRNEVCSASS